MRLPSIKISAPLFITTPVLVVAALLMVIWLSQSRSAVRDLADQNVGQIHAQIAGHLETLLSVPDRVNRLNARLIAEGSLDPDDPASWLPTLVAQAHSFDELSAITWGHADGRSLWIARYANGAYYFAIKSEPGDAPMVEYRIGDDGSIPDEPTSRFPLDVNTRPWFTTPRDAGRTAWSAPYVWAGAEDATEPTLGISHGIPLYDASGSFSGVIDADLSLNDISHFLGTLAIGRTGMAFIVDHEGGMIASSAKEAWVVTSDGRRTVAASSEDRRVAAASARLDRATASPSGIEMEINGEPQLVRASRVGQDAGLDWTLVSVIPRRDFTATIDAGFKRSGMISIIAIVGAGVLGVVATLLLMSPLMSLVKYARRIGAGDLDTPFELRHAPEYEHLANELNRMIVSLREHARMRSSLAVAMEVQKNLLPHDTPHIEGLDIAGHSTYCDETGGDYYDYLDLSDIDQRTIAIAVGDVMGHGVAAAMLMATARGMLRSRIQSAGSLGEFLEHLNGLLINDTGGTRFMTMLLMTINATDREMRWASAGHGPPIVFDPSTRRLRQAEGGGVPLGVIDGEQYEEQMDHDVRSGQIYLAATDGLWETKNDHGELFGMARVQELLDRHAERSAAEISQSIREALKSFRGELAPDDDLTFVVVKIL